VSVNCKVLFVYGSDDFLVDRRARVLYDTYCENGEIFNCEQKSDVRLFVNKLCESLNTVPMFAPTNNVWVRGVNFFSGAESEEVKNSVAFLLDTVKKLNDGVVLISAHPVDKRTKLIKGLSQLAECYDVTDISDKNFDEFIRDVCAENVVKITNEAVALLQNLIGKDTRLMQFELEKLASYIYQDRDTITDKDVNLLVDPSSSGEFFQQIEKFYSPSIDEKLDAIGRYFYFVNEARPLIAGLQNRTRLMIQLRALVDSNKIQLDRSISKTQLENLAKLLNVNAFEKNSCNIFSQNPWYLSKLLDSVNRYSLHRLLDIQLALMDALAETTSRYDDQVSVIKELALKF
jgi:DNA polymerase-3 subunit delta